MKKRSTIHPAPVSEGSDTCLFRNYGGGYYSREKEKVKLMSAYMKGQNPLLICGAPRSGKTVLAKEVAWVLAGNHDSETDAHVYVLKFDGSIRNTISQYHIPLYLLLPVGGWGASDEELEQQLYADKLSFLRHVQGDPVFVLDGVDSVSLEALFQEPEYPDLLSLGTVIITSSDTSASEWVIPPLPKKYRCAGEKDRNLYTREEKIILQNAALLPPTGLSILMFLRSQGREQKETVLRLIREGRLPASADRGVLPPDWAYSGDDQDYQPFLTYLEQRARKACTSQRNFDAICQVFKNAARYLEDRDGLVAHRAGKLFRECSDFREGFPLEERFLEKQRQLEPQNPVTLAQALYEAGYVRGFLGVAGRGDGMLEEARALFVEALVLREAALDSGHIDLARTRLALAQTYDLQYRFAEAYQLVNIALEEYSCECPEEDESLAESLFCCGCMNPYVFGDRKTRRGYTERAAAIVDKGGCRSTLQAEVYTMLAYDLPDKELDRSFALQQRALEIRKKKVPNQRYPLYIAHRDMAKMAHRKKDYQLEAHELYEALVILMTILPPDHPVIKQNQKEIGFVLRRGKPLANQQEDNDK